MFWAGSSEEVRTFAGDLEAPLPDARHIGFCSYEYAGAYGPNNPHYRVNQATQTRFANASSQALVLHDSTELSYRRTGFASIGMASGNADPVIITSAARPLRYYAAVAGGHRRMPPLDVHGRRA